MTKELTTLHTSDALRNETLQQAVEPAIDYLHAATSPNTRKAYQSDVRHFLQSGGQLPASIEQVMHYLEQYATQLNARTLVRRLTALKHWHTYQGFPDPTHHPAIRKLLTGIKNVHGQPKMKAPPITLAILEQMVDQLRQGSRLVDCRNLALLLVGFFGAFRRSELVSLQWEWIQWVPEGIEILIPRSKTDQEGEGQTCAIPLGQSTLCPVSALTAWQAQSGIQTGAVFRAITRGGQIKSEAIRPEQVNRWLKLLAQHCQLPHAERYSSHSLRRGFATEASKRGAPFGSIMRQGRWQHEGTVLGYIDEGKRFDQNAADFMLNHPADDT